MAANTIVFTAVSGLVLLAIVVAVLRLRGWRRDPPASAPGGSTYDAVGGAIRSPTTWSLLFLLLVLGAVAGSLALVGAIPVPESVAPAVRTALLVGTGLVLAGFVFAGVYASVRSWGYGSAPAVGLGSLAVGLLALVVVVIQLFLG